jgi:hypothetical protein
MGRSREIVRWLAPTAGRSKINVDAAVSKLSARGVVGVVCRSSEGNFLGASAVVYDGVTCPRTLEALACREGLVVADDIGLGPVVVALDYLEVVNGIQGENLGILSSVLVETKAMIQQRGLTTLVHERRQYNVEAHRLARYTSTLPVGRYVWFLEPPIDLDIHVTA